MNGPFWVEVTVEFGPNVLRFPDAESAVAFLREQGCERQEYQVTKSWLGGDV